MNRSEVFASAGVLAGCATALSLVAGCINASTAQHPHASSAHHTHVRHVKHVIHVMVFGMMDQALNSETASAQIIELRHMKAAGIDSIRLDANWRVVQRNGPGTFDWAHLDQLIGSARAVRMAVDLVIDGCPAWAAIPHSERRSWPQPKSARQYAAFAKSMGIKVFEIWNEPNDTKSWQPTASPAAYTKMLRAAYIAIKQAEPSAFIIAGGLAPLSTSGGGSYSAIKFLKAMYADGAKGYFDAVGMHPYPAGNL